MILRLPYPISANVYWRSIWSPKRQRVVVLVSKQAEAWKEEAGWIARAAGWKSPTPKPVALRITHHHKALGLRQGKPVKNGAVYDLDNVIKVTLDGLKGVVFVDDAQVQRIVAQYGDPTDKGGVDVEVLEFIPELAPIFEGGAEVLPQGQAERIYWRWHNGEIADILPALRELDRSRAR